MGERDVELSAISSMRQRPTRLPYSRHDQLRWSGIGSGLPRVGTFEAVAEGLDIEATQRASRLPPGQE